MAEITFSDLTRKLWVLGELADYSFENLRSLRKEVNRAISISPFDSNLRTYDKLLQKAIIISKSKQ